MPRKLPDDITSSKITDNQTWNTCPSCGLNWHDEVATPGLIHRTRLCYGCQEVRNKSHRNTTSVQSDE